MSSMLDLVTREYQQPDKPLPDDRDEVDPELAEVLDDDDPGAFPDDFDDGGQPRPDLYAGLYDALERAAQEKRVIALLVEALKTPAEREAAAAERERREREDRAAADRDPCRCPLAPLVPAEVSRLSATLNWWTSCTPSVPDFPDEITAGVGFGRVVACCVVDPTHKLVVGSGGQRCLGGCAPDQVGRRLAELLGAHAEHAAAECQVADAEKKNAMLQDMSIARLWTDDAVVRHVVDGLVVAGELTLLVGGPGAKKTWAAMMVAIAVAGGVALLGRKVVRGRVLLVLLEGSERDWSRRLAVLARGMGVDREALVGRLDVYDAQLDVTDPASYQRLVERVVVGQYDVVVIDNLSEARGPGSENDNEVMLRSLQPIRDLVRRHDLAVVLVHHAAKGTGEARGAGAVVQVADEGIAISAGPANDSVVTLRRIGKSRSGEVLREPVRFKLADLKEGRSVVSVAPTLVDQRDDEDDEDEDEDLEAPLSEADQQRCDRIVEILAATPLSSSELTKALKGRAETAVRLRDLLARKQVIEQRDGKWAVR
jgi:hypothetical protein